MRPEHEKPPEMYYDDTEAKKYTTNTRIQQIQAEMAERAIELLALPENKPCLILDIGCGSGLSGEVLEEYGHEWVGLDISESMLDVADVNGDLFLQDAGHGVGFRAGVFDGCISISCIQWLCNADYKKNNPKKRLLKLFTTLYASLCPGARAVFQFYPENSEQTALITSCAMQAGFGGGLVVDYPNSTKRKKYFLCLFAGGSSIHYDLPSGLSDEMAIDEDEEEASGPRHIQSSNDKKAHRQREKIRKLKKKLNIKDKAWVLRKKESRRKKGDIVKPDTKYTARKRGPKF